MVRHLTLAVLTVLASTRLVQAGATTPTLVLASGTATVSSSGVRVVRFEAAYDYSNAVQADYDLEVIVFQNQTFARYPVSGPVRVGSTPAVADGLAATDLPALDAAGSPAPSSVRVVALGPAEITVALPDTFSAAAATAALVATVDEGTVLSNPLGFVLP
jgi:hypothetical protein